MKCLALSCGTGVYQDADTVYVVHTGGNGLAVARFVTLLISCLATIAGVTLAATATVVGGLIALVVAGLAAWLFVVLGKKRARLFTRPPNSLPRFVSLHLREQEIRDTRGEVLGPLSAARLELVFQATSSAKALALVLPGHKLVIARGNPFAGDVGSIIQALVSVGVRPPP